MFFPNAKIAIHKIDAIALMEDDNPDTVASHFGHEIKCHKVDIELEEGDKIKDFEVIHTQVILKELSVCGMVKI